MPLDFKSRLIVSTQSAGLDATKYKILRLSSSDNINVVLARDKAYFALVLMEMCRLPPILARVWPCRVVGGVGDRACQGANTHNNLCESGQRVNIALSLPLHTTSYQAV